MAESIIVEVSFKKKIHRQHCIFQSLDARRLKDFHDCLRDGMVKSVNVL